MLAPGTYPIQNALHELSVTSDGTAAWPTLDQDEWLKRLGSVPLMYQPGERWQYRLSSDALGVLVSRVAGQSFEAFLRERLCAPLGMKDTGFSVPSSELHRLPTSTRGVWLRHGRAHAPAGLGASGPIRLGRGPGNHGLRRSIRLPRDPALPNRPGLRPCTGTSGPALTRRRDNAETPR
ncbi:beta-lactamase family protein [Amycolatopsis sp. 195334CR]|nr:beta-lactamase family protein [Amycolatopsis sp. 195334CR]